jgi:hypothetical protein
MIVNVFGEPNMNDKRRLGEFTSSIAEMTETLRVLRGVGEINNPSWRESLKEISRLAQGPGIDFKAISANATLAKSLAGISGQGALGFDAKQFAQSFVLPDQTIVSKLLREITSGIHGRYGLSEPQLLSSIREMQKPWFDIENQLSSLTGFAKLQGIGHLIAANRSFEANAVATLRADLGDWRDWVSFPENLSGDAAERESFYVARGLQSDLTDFPSETFEEVLDVSGLRRDVPALIETYGHPVSGAVSAIDKENYGRNSFVYDWLQRFESQIRRFIDRLMTRAYGETWPRHKLPNGMFERWTEKQQRDPRGNEFPLIYYADFTDYVLVICKKDNWREVFSTIFQREEFVRESMQRLYLPRLATMHSRPLGNGDELYIFVEIKRLTELFSAEP